MLDAVEQMDELEQDIFDNPLDNEAAKAEEKKLLLPEGWYTTELPTTLTAKVNDEGRRVARYFATVINNKDTERRGKIGFGMSPDVKYKEGEDKADFSYRMFLNARKALIEATGAEPSTEADVVRYIETYPVQLRIIQTPDNENLVVAIRAVRE